VAEKAIETRSAGPSTTKMTSESLYHLLDLNIDKVINPFIPRNQCRHLPKPISHFLGYRSEPAKEPPALISWILTVFGTIAGLCVVGAVYNYAPGVHKWHPPPMIASLGASAILDYNTIKSPLAQPRNQIIGHTISAIVGTAIARGFQLTPDIFANYSWVTSAIACAVASVAMSMTNTVHPPGGATAILACTQSQIIALGWMFPPIILLASTLMMVVACLFNNTLRQYPTFWWSPEDVGSKLPGRRRQGQNDEESQQTSEEGQLEKKQSRSDSGSERTLAHEMSNEVAFIDGLDEVHISPYQIRLPQHVALSDEQVNVLKQLQSSIRARSEVN